MIIFGIKFTHDGTISLIDNCKLIFSYEMEKLDNSNRYSHFNISFDRINKILESYGYSFTQIDRIVVDGWVSSEDIKIDWSGQEHLLSVAEYGNSLKFENILDRKKFKLPGFQNMFYTSYTHVAGHIACTYCTSPFTRLKQDSYILVWDGGMFPRFFYFNNSTNTIDDLGDLFPLKGSIYSIFAQYFGPFKNSPQSSKNSSSIAGKVMAYIALGNYQEVIMEHLIETYNLKRPKRKEYPHFFATAFKRLIKSKKLSDDDILYTFHIFIERLLIEGLTLKTKENKQVKNLCLAGGLALNIKWNSAIRNSNLFQEVWVPPFPNDSGSAIGTACCEMIHSENKNKLEWNVYSGPPVMPSIGIEGWQKEEMTIHQLAKLIYTSEEPVVFLNGNAELGPRALGNRSILSSAVNPRSKKYLNDIKKREDYRPIAPICLEEFSHQIFVPGYSDQFMLFDHLVKDDWKERIPAVCHLDGTARLQTINKTNNTVIFDLLTEYLKLSGIPLLCNTSANFNGKGFFPDVYSAMRWNKVNYIWSNGLIYFKSKKIEFR